VTSDTVLANIQDIVRDVLDNDSVQLSRSTIAQDVPFWDSLAHIKIMVAVEKHFQIRFDVDELNSFENVGQLVDGVLAKKEG